MKGLFTLLLTTLPILLFAQSGGVAIGGGPPDSSAMLDVKSTEKGMLLPRVTTSERNAIQKPAPGLLVFDTDKQCLYMFEGVQWRPIGYLGDEDDLPLLERSIWSSDFGKSVAANGEQAVVGSTYTAYVFERADGQWLEVQELVPVTPHDYFYWAPQYGHSVDIDGDRAVVGAPGDEAVYVFEKSGNAWTETAKLRATGGPTNIDFGQSVTVDGNIIAVGAPRDTVFSNAQEGAVYIFQYIAGSWTQVSRLYQNLSGYAPFDYFGWAINLDLPHLVIGSPYFGANEEGAAHIYKRNITVAWDFLERKNSSSPNAWYGAAVAVSDSLVVIGRPGFSNGRGGFSKYDYQISSGLYDGPPTSSSAAGLDDNSYNGASVAADGTTYAVGMPHQHPFGSTSYNTTQQVRVYTHTSTHNIQYDESSNGFGASVALTGFDVLIGNPERRSLFVRNVE